VGQLQEHASAATDQAIGMTRRMEKDSVRVWDYCTGVLAVLEICTVLFHLRNQGVLPNVAYFVE
jgi:hypothetical protein